MRLLLETHILPWCLVDHPALSGQARTLIADPTNQIYISAISLWALAIKTQLGKRSGDVGEIRVVAQANGFLPLPFALDHAIAVAGLPMHHRDLFDRALIAQAHCEPLDLLTHDQALVAYGTSIILV